MLEEDSFDTSWYTRVSFIGVSILYIPSLDMRRKLMARPIMIAINKMVKFTDCCHGTGRVLLHDCIVSRFAMFTCAK